MYTHCIYHVINCIYKIYTNHFINGTLYTLHSAYIHQWSAPLFPNQGRMVTLEKNLSGPLLAHSALEK